MRLFLELGTPTRCHLKRRFFADQYHMGSRFPTSGGRRGARYFPYRRFLKFDAPSAPGDGIEIACPNGRQTENRMVGRRSLRTGAVRHDAATRRRRVLIWAPRRRIRAYGFRCRGGRRLRRAARRGRGRDSMAWRRSSGVEPATRVPSSNNLRMDSHAEIYIENYTSLIDPDVVPAPHRGQARR